MENNMWNQSDTNSNIRTNTTNKYIGPYSIFTGFDRRSGAFGIDCISPATYKSSATYKAIHILKAIGLQDSKAIGQLHQYFNTFCA